MAVAAIYGGPAVIPIPLQLFNEFALLRRLPVAIDTKTHRKAFLLIQLVHCLHRSVANATVFSRFDMMKMREADKIRQKMDFLPSHSFVFAVGQTDFFDPRAFGFDCAMAVHTYIEAWERGAPACFHPGMTVTAVYFVFSGMKFVGKGNRLFGLVICVVKQTDAVVCQKIKKHKKAGQKACQQKSPDSFFLPCFFKKLFQV